MKLIIIVYGEAMDAEILDLLQSNGQNEYTKWTKVQGKGKHSEPHLLSHVWPKANNALMTCVEDDIAEKIMTALREYKKNHLKEGVKAFLLPVEEII